ncbi:uncharacterized protein LOC143242564 isoform X2 [Tachypleus tridentatus]|uniref:uncharacterized protein LOC143242564 isoform X2 n=1 Tax=Tachypleus tridentatus TaxID=6853 RepID=UPI003FCF51AF
MSYLKSRNFSVPKKLIESLSEVLLNHCGKMVNSQCVKTALLYIQREELKQLSAHNPTIQEKPVQHQASTSRLSTKRKRASDDIKGEEPLKFQENTCRNSSWKSPGMNAVDKKICELTEKACEKMKTESTLRYMLPPLATKASPEASMLLKVLAKQMRIQKQELLMNHFKYIFSYLVRHCSKEEMEKALTYVQTETNIEIGSLLRCDYQRIHNELLLHISTHYEQVFSGLAMLAWKDESYDGTKPITKPEDIVMATVEI